jgi:hypothetical protein
VACPNSRIRIQPGDAIFRNFKFHALAEIDRSKDNGSERHQYKGDGTDSDS